MVSAARRSLPDGRPMSCATRSSSHSPQAWVITRASRMPASAWDSREP